MRWNWLLLSGIAVYYTACIGGMFYALSIDSMQLFGLVIIALVIAPGPTKYIVDRVDK